FFSSRRRHTRSLRDWSSDVCSSDLLRAIGLAQEKLISLGDQHRSRETAGGCLGAQFPAQRAQRLGFTHPPNGEAWRRGRACKGRSEERRVGKECRYRRAPEYKKRKA